MGDLRFVYTVRCTCGKALRVSSTRELGVGDKVRCPGGHSVGLVPVAPELLALRSQVAIWAARAARQ